MTTTTYLPGIALLRKWLEDHGVPAHRFARKNGMDPGEFHKLLAGKRKSIGIEFAAKIEDGTDGEIKIRMFIPVEIEEHESYRS
jgi:hypothetical protein